MHLGSALPRRGRTGRIRPQAGLRGREVQALQVQPVVGRRPDDVPRTVGIDSNAGLEGRRQLRLTLLAALQRRVGASKPCGFVPFVAVLSLRQHMTTSNS